MLFNYLPCFTEEKEISRFFIEQFFSRTEELWEKKVSIDCIAVLAHCVVSNFIDTTTRLADSFGDFLVVI